MKQILLLFVALFANMAYAQNNVSCTFDISMPMAVTEENYLKADSALWDEYAKRTKALYGQIDENPDKKWRSLSVRRAVKVKDNISSLK